MGIEEAAKSPVPVLPWCGSARLCALIVVCFGLTACDGGFTARETMLARSARSNRLPKSGRW